MKAYERTPEELYADVQAKAEVMANARPHFPAWKLFWLLWRVVVGKPIPKRIPLNKDDTLRQLRALC